MKILHTSDWHLGQQFYNYDRAEEHRDMLRQIADIVRDEQPDAMVVSGDIFHTGNPSSAAVEMYNHALLDMHRACPDMQIVVTAGNHDSAVRLVVNNALWEHFNVTVVGHMARNNDENRTPDYASHIVEVTGKDGKTIGYIAAVPHCYEANYPAADPNLQRHDRAVAYYSGLAKHIADINADNLPVVLMAHMAVSGSDFSGHDQIGGMECQEAETLGTGYDYIALGHIHTPQNVNSRARYCGTPIAVNFGEKGEHSVSIVEVEHGMVPVIATRAIKNIRPLIDVPTPVPAKDAKEEDLPEECRPKPFSEVRQLLADIDPDKECYIRVVIKVDDSLTQLVERQIKEAVEGKKCKICGYPYIFTYKRDIPEKETVEMFNASTLKEKSPIEVAELFFKMRGIEMRDNWREKIIDSTHKALENEKSE